MVTIPQHGEGRLNDLASFIADLEDIQPQVDYWLVQIDECTGPNALVFEEMTRDPVRISPRAFAGLCGAIVQTIDGEFVAMQGERELVRLLAFDSSFWEISGPPEFERRMVGKYGTYEGSPR